MKLKIWVQDQRTEYLESTPGNETLWLFYRCKSTVKVATEAHTEGIDLL